MSGISFSAPDSFNAPGGEGVNAFGVPSTIAGAGASFDSGLADGATPASASAIPPAASTTAAAAAGPAGSVASGWWQQTLALAENWGTRAAIIFLGVILVAVGAISLARQHGGTNQ